MEERCCIFCGGRNKVYYWEPAQGLICDSCRSKAVTGYSFPIAKKLIQEIIDKTVDKV